MKKVTAEQLLALHARGIDTSGLTNKQIYRLVQSNEALSRPKTLPDPYKSALRALRTSHGKTTLKDKVTRKAKNLQAEFQRRMAELDMEVEVEEIPTTLQAQS